MWKMDRRMFAGAMAGAAIWIAGGCDGSAPSVDTSKTEATVTGTVKVAGSPATEGEVIFDPANYARKDAPLARAPIGPDGKFTIKTLTGENMVSITGAAAKKNPILQQQKKPVNVTSGSNTIDLEFGSTAPSK